MDTHIEKYMKITFALMAFTVCSVLFLLFGPTHTKILKKPHLTFYPIYEINRDFWITKTEHIDSFSYGHNLTHLWSWQLADKTYFQLSRDIPCHNITYKRGPADSNMDTCDLSPANEFSLLNSIQAQKWLYDHQHPANCSNKRIAIIQKFARSGFGSTVHQIAWAFGIALADDRIAVYQTPGDWMYAHCASLTPDCYFLPITNCSVPSEVDGKRVIRISANFGYWRKPVIPPIFQKRTFGWYRAQLTFYLMRFKPQIIAHAQSTIAQYFNPPSLDFHHPYIAVYIRRSDKVKMHEMKKAFALEDYFDLFDTDARRTNIRTVYINSEDEQVFNEFAKLNKEKQGFYKLLSLNVTRSVTYGGFYGMVTKQAEKIILEFLTDLFIEVNADLHVGTLTSNWCRLVDEIRLVLGKIIPFYTPENLYLVDW